jgi:hypothetical protein
MTVAVLQRVGAGCSHPDDVAAVFSDITSGARCFSRRDRENIFADLGEFCATCSP